LAPETTGKDTTPDVTAHSLTPPTVIVNTMPDLKPVVRPGRKKRG
jgi:hypothetical protein